MPISQQITKNISIKEVLRSYGPYDPDRWCMTFAIQADTSDEELLRFLRSKVPAALKEQQLQSILRYQLTQLHQELYEALRITRKSNLEYDGSDTCVVVEFYASQLARARLSDVGKQLTYTLVEVDSVKTNSLQVAHIPDFTSVLMDEWNQFHWQMDDKTSLDSVVVAITPETVSVYDGTTLSSDQLVMKRFNAFTKPEHNRYYERMSITGSQAIRHGNASEKHLRTEYAGWLFFVRNSLRLVTRRIEFGFLQILFSQAFKPLKENLTKILDQELAGISYQFSFNSSATFKDAELLTAKDFLDYEMALESSADKVQTPHKVATALREGRADTLVLDPQLDRVGYVTRDGSCYSYPVKNSKQVPSISPWLLKQAADTSTQVIMSDDFDAEVMATLRY